MPSQTIYDIIRSGRTLTQQVANNPTERIINLAEKLFTNVSPDTQQKSDYQTREDYTKEELDRAFHCGKFPYRPSDLFLMIYCDVLRCMEKDPWAGLVSPSLLGSSGVIPLTIVSVIPDIMRHYRNLIANADFEVLIATNYWENSYSSSVVHQGLIELSKRHEGKEKKPVVKLIYDRGNIKQVIQNRQTVPPDQWVSVGLPSQEDIPNVDFEVLNYHKPMMGTFHAKYMIVDRKVACLNSNNIQDRVNVEMMTHVEGRIVDSFYDMALLSWGEKLNPPLPLLKGGGGAPKEGEEHTFNEDNRYLKDILLAEGAKTDRKSWHPDPKENDATHPSIEQQPTIPRAQISEQHFQDTLTKVPEHLPSDINESTEKLDENDPDPIARQHVPALETSGAGEVRKTDLELNAAEDKYGSPQAVANHLNAGMQQLMPTAPPEVAKGFHPHMLHKPHKPFPIAMVNRKPYGTPGHGDLKVPQNVAWLAAFRLAQKSIFIQSPTFNAYPVVQEILNACRKGIDCVLYLDLGFNDGGEMLPFQGGTNSKVVADMYNTLNAEGKQHHLKVYWYVAKDQDKPIDAADKRRNCHVKFCIVDDHIGIQGNGNQDTQSWFHSQEINIMVDSAEMCAEWRAGLDNNQNTKLYGLISDKDGLWRDSEGNILDSKAGKGGPLALLKGMQGAMARVQGKGGF